MEEILASIRRIIADDQPLPGALAPEPAASEPAESRAKAEAPAHATAKVPPVDAMPPEQGLIATPQFPTPAGPAPVRDTLRPTAPSASEAPPNTVLRDPAPVNAVALPDRDVHEAALRAMHEEPDMRAAAVNAAHDHVYEGQFFEEAIAEESIDETPAPIAPEPVAEEPPMPATAETARDLPPREEAPDAGLFSAATSQTLASAFNTLAVSRLAADSQELRGLARDMLRPLLKDWLDAHLPGLVESIIREEIERMARRTR